MRAKWILSTSAIAFFLFIIPFFWFGNNVILLGGETYTSVNYEQFFLRNLFFWNSSYGFGLPNISIIPQLYHLLTYCLSLIFSISVAQRIVLGLILSLSFLSSLVFLKERFNQGNMYPLILGSLFYVFNPFFASMFGWVPTYGFLFIFTPLILAQFIRIIEGKGNGINFAYLYILGFCYAGVAMNLGLYSLLYILILLFGISHLLNGKNKFSIIKRLVISLSILLISNSYWLLPFIKTYKSIFGGAAIYAFNFSDISLYRLPIFNSLTLNEYYWFTIKTKEGDYFYPFSRWYEHPAQAIVILFVVCVFFALMQGRKKLKNKNTLLFFVILLIGIFLTKGTAAPAGELYRFLLRFVKYFGIYRSSDIKFPFFVVFSLSYLIPYALYSLFKINQIAKIKMWLLFCFFISIVFLGLPFILGSVIPSRQSTINSLKIEVPSYWILAMNYLASDEGRILVFPKNYSPLDNYTWGYKGVYLPYSFIKAPVIGYTIGYGSSIEESRFNSINLIFSLYEKKDYLAMKKAISLFNIRTILLRNDFDLEQNAFDVNQIYSEVYQKKSLQKNLDLHFSRRKDFGNLVLYSVPNDFSLGQVFIPSKMKLLHGERSASLEKAIGDKSYNVGTALYFDNESKFPILELAEYSGNVEYQKKSPTKYDIKIKSKNQKVPLVFSESYSDGWKINAEAVSADIIEKINRTHSVVNGYANSWMIDTDLLCADPESCSVSKDGVRSVIISISYSPQNQFIIGMVITLVGLIFSLAAIVYYVLLGRIKIAKK